MIKKILIRVDASNMIGTGHVMRCLTLVNEAKQRGWNICFLVRDPSEHIIKLISCAGHKVRKLKSIVSRKKQSFNHLRYGDWLSVSQENDALETLDVARDFKPDWIVVDHYALDATWHALVNRSCAKILVIDDLGDRNLICDLLLDQNLGAKETKYAGKVSENCKFLIGPQFALLREEFKEWRERSLKSRIDRKVEKILITMGGIDAENYTFKVLKELSQSKHVKNYEFIIIIGELYPHTEILNEFVESSEMNLLVLSNVNNMAEIMINADLCIGAAGSTTWERCCLGLPTIALAIADNQIEILKALEKNGIVISSSVKKIRLDFEKFLCQHQVLKLNLLSTNSSSVCDGKGVQRVLDQLEQSNV